MLDAIIRKRIDPPLAVIAHQAVKWRISATAVTVAGFVLGLAAAGLVVAQLYSAAVVALLACGFLDGMDGAIARQTRTTDLGGFLDVVLNFVIYVAVVFSFALADPPANALAAAFLTTSLMLPAVTYLAYEMFAAKRGLGGDFHGTTALYYLSRLTEGTETFVCLLLMCLFPAWFATIAVVYSVMCWIAGGARIAAAMNAFGEIDRRRAAAVAEAAE